jgi:hypothetical protein
MRTSAPCALASCSDPFEPGIRGMSPKQVKITQQVVDPVLVDRVRVPPHTSMSL